MVAIITCQVTCRDRPRGDGVREHGRPQLSALLRGLDCDAAARWGSLLIARNRDFQHAILRLGRDIIKNRILRQEHAPFERAVASFGQRIVLSLLLTFFALLALENEAVAFNLQLDFIRSMPGTSMEILYDCGVSVISTAGGSMPPMTRAG